MTVLPPCLNPGDVIGVAAPAGYLMEYDRYLQGCTVLRDMGFQIHEPEKRWPGYGYLADTDKARAEELHSLWRNPEVKAIFALRGGFGCLRLLSLLDLEVVRKHPKLLIGFSDISVLLNYLVDTTGTVCLHGPGLASLSDSDKSSCERLYHCLRGDWDHCLKEKIEIVKAAPEVRGTLLGGNLSSLVTLLGTPWFPRLSGAIVVLEDINEPLYRLDRLLTQLWLSGQMAEIGGLILGQFCGDGAEPVDKLRRNEFVWARVAELSAPNPAPIWGNFPIGHCRRNLTVPLGAPATMDSNTGTLHFFRD